MVKCGFFSLLLSLLLVFTPAAISAKELILGGQNIGVELNVNGLLVSGTYKFMVGDRMYTPSEDGIRKGDLIVAANGVVIDSVDDLMSVLSCNDGVESAVKLTILRDYSTFDVDVLVGRKNVGDKWKTGLFVKEKVLGVGTVTFYDMSNNTYGALGHRMGSIDGNNKFYGGKIYESEVKGIKKSKNGDPGEKIAIIDEDKYIGSVDINNEYGIYGIIEDDVSSYLVMESASRDEVKTGKAYIYTVIDGDELEKFEIEIVKLKKQNSIDTKGITFKVIDKKLLSKTNGIVAGMSGSPIVQDGKIVGAVTHVLIDKVNYWYGIYIDFMLEQSDTLS